MESQLVKSKLYLSRSIFGEAEFLADLLAKTPETLATKRVVICEEKFTMTLECMLSQKLGGIMSTRVLSFGKICDMVKMEEKYLSKTSEVMLLSSILAELDSQLELFDFARKTPSFASSIYDILSLLASSHVDFAKLKAQDLPPALKKKTSDICKIWEAYTAKKQGMFLDATDKMQLLLSAFDSVEILRDAEIYIIGQVTYTNQMLAVISKMASVGKLCVFCTNGEAFPRLKNAMALTSSVEVVLVEEEFSPLQSAVFDSISGSAKHSEGIYLRKFSCENFQRESLALKVKHLIQNGESPQQIKITLANFEEECEPLCNELESLGVPYFASKHETLDSFPFSQFLILAMNLTISDFSISSLRKMLSSPFCPLSKEDSFSLENFLISRNVDRKRIFKNEIFQNEGNLELRDTFLAGVNIFPEKAITFSSFKSAISRFAVENSSTIAKTQILLARHAGISRAELLALSLKKTFEVIDEMETVLGDRSFSLEDLRNIFASGLCEKEISTIPPTLCAVSVCDLPSSIFAKTKHGFFLHASKSFFPSVQKDIAILSDKDIGILLAKDIEISPSIEVVNQKNEEICNLALLCQTQTLHIFFSELCSGKGESPSEKFSIFAKANPVVCCENEYHYPLEMLQLSIEETLASSEKTRMVASYILDSCIFSKQNAKEIFAREQIKESMLAKEISSHIYSAFSTLSLQGELDEFAKKAHIQYVENGLDRKEFSPSHLEKYFACPYSSFLTQNIGLREREKGIMKELDSGIFLHSILEKFTYAMPHINRKDIPELVEKIATDISQTKKFAKFASGERFSHLLSKLTLEGTKICNHIFLSSEKSKYRTVLQEFSFGGASAVETPNGLRLFGKVDRIDEYGNNFFVVDYKTGSISTDDHSFYHGTKMQSELYLYATAQLTKKQPCGCLYLPISDNYSENATSYVMSGKLLLDNDFLNDLDTTLLPKESSEIYPITKKVDGNFSLRGNTLLSKEQFSAHIESAVATAESAKAELARGYIFPTPFAKSSFVDSCTYCKYTSICKSCGEDNTRGLSKLADEEEKNEN